MQSIPDKLNNLLEKRKLENSLRRLSLTSEMVDFCSNDYLGFSSSSELYDTISEKMDQLTSKSNGATGSRLISGNSDLVERLESRVSNFFEGEAALFFNSGYNANQSILSAIPQKGDTILYDELVHASIKDGLRLGFANKISFKHNDLEDFERRLKNSKGDIYVVVESIYSMDGDRCPLKKLLGICKKYNAYLIVDEAHSLGVVGDKGQGICINERVQEDVFARIYTFGKALGVHGACVVGSQLLKQYLINFARPFIYTTALPHHSLVSVSCALDYLNQAKEPRKRLTENIKYFQNSMAKAKDEMMSDNMKLIESNTAIQGVIIPDNILVRNKALHLQESGLDVRAILSPTVKPGSERLRICLHSFNTFAEIDLLISRVLE